MSWRCRKKWFINFLILIVKTNKCADFLKKKKYIYISMELNTDDKPKYI